MGLSSIITSNLSFWLAIVVLLILAMVGAASAADWYVSVDGNNANLGTLAQPKADFNNTAWFNSSTVLPGDTVYLINGTWIDKQMFLTSTSGNSQYVVGNSTSYVTITSYNGTPTLKNNSLSGSNIYGIYQTNTGSGITQRIRISNITIEGYEDGAMYIRLSKYIEITNMTINNTGVGSSGNCVVMNDVNDSVFSNNDIGLCGYSSLGLTSTTLDVFNITIENNTFHNNNHHSLINLKNPGGGSTKTLYDIYIRNNTFRDHLTWNGIALYSTNTTPPYPMRNIVLSNNQFSNITGNVNIETTSLTNSTWENNTIKDSTAGFNTQSGNVYTSVMDNATFKNSIAIDNVTNPATMSINPNSTFYWDSNQFHGSQWDYKVSFGTFNITNAIATNNIHNISTASRGKIIFRNTSNVMLSENGANTTYYYNDRSEYITTGNETVRLVEYNMSIQPSENSSTATNTTDRVTLNYLNKKITRLNFTNNDTVVKNLTLNSLAGNNYSLYNLTTDTKIGNTQTSVGGTVYFNNSLLGMYYILEDGTATADTTPPASITSLINTTYVVTSIRWNWTEPPDADYSHISVYLDGVFQQNVSAGTQSYTATSLNQNTSYTIATRAVDYSGNMNETWVNHTASTKSGTVLEWTWCTSGCNDVWELNSTLTDVNNASGNIVLNSSGYGFTINNSYSGTSSDTIRSVSWLGQTFYISSDSTIYGFSAPVHRLGTLSQTLVVRIWNANDTGYPTTEVVNQSFASDDVSTVPITLHDYILTSPQTLTAGNYTVIFSSTTANISSNNYKWNVSNGNLGYADGSKVTSSNQGTSWTKVNTDYPFKIYDSPGYATSGSIKLWHDFGSGNQGSINQFNASIPAGCSINVYSNNTTLEATGESSLVNTTLTDKQQIQYITLELLSDGSCTPTVYQNTLWSEEASQGTPAATRVPLTYAANYVVAGSAIGLSAVLYITYRRRRGRVMMFIPILLYNNRRRR